MFIEQIIEFELRGPAPSGRTWNPKTGYFYDETKISKENIWVDYYLIALSWCPSWSTPGKPCHFHWQLGGYNNHQPCSSNDVSHCSSSQLSTELDSAVSSF